MTKKFANLKYQCQQFLILEVDGSYNIKKHEWQIYTIAISVYVYSTINKCLVIWNNVKSYIYLRCVKCLIVFIHLSTEIFQISVLTLHKYRLNETSTHCGANKGEPNMYHWCKYITVYKVQYMLILSSAELWYMLIL